LDRALAAQQRLLVAMAVLVVLMVTTSTLEELEIITVALMAAVVAALVGIPKPESPHTLLAAMALAVPCELFGALVAHSHQQTRVICNGTLYSHC
jgi:hypothetical protein